MKLITELTEEVEYITEEKDGKKNMYIEGIFLQSAIKNRNGRMYPEGVMDKEVARYVKESVDAGRALGELGHPNGPQINLDRVSHRIVSLTKDGTNYNGRAVLGETNYGKTAKAIIEMGGKIGVSSRGMGTLKVNSRGINEVQNDFKLATAADIVADPSAPDAFVNGIMEGVDWIYDQANDSWRVEKMISEAKTQIENALRSRILREQKFKIFENYMHQLSKIEK